MVRLQVGSGKGLTDKREEAGVRGARGEITEDEVRSQFSKI